MQSLVAFANRFGDRPIVQCVLWGAIALGIVPAIVAQNILPFDSFVLNFGIEIERIDYLPKAACLLLFAAGAIAAVVRRQTVFVLLLLPLLALYGYDLERLNFKLPSYSDAQDELRDNYYRSRELDKPPTADSIADTLDGVVLSDNRLIAFDRDAVAAELEDLGQTRQNIDPGQQDNIDRLNRRIADLDRKIRRANTQSRLVRKALRDTSVISYLSLGLTDRHLKNKLDAALETVVEKRNALVSKRNAARAALERLYESLAEQGKIDNRLYQLDAEVKTYLWASKALEDWRVSRAYGLACFLVLLVIVARFSLGSWIYLFTLSASFAVSMLYVEAPLAFRCWTIVGFLLASLVLRVLYLACINNYPLLRRQPGGFLLKTAGTTLVYYVPFIVLILAGFYLSHSIERRVESDIYAIEWIEDSNENRDTLRRDIDIGIDAYFAERERQAQDDLDAISTAGRGAVGNIRGGVIEAYETAFPPDLGADYRVDPCTRPDQWVFAAPDCTRKEIRHSMNEGYKRFRKSQLEALEASTKTYEDRIADAGSRAAARAREDLSANILAIRLGLKKQLSHLYSALDFYFGLAQILLALMILKSLLYLFARIFFASESGEGERLIQFEPDPRPVQTGTIREVSERLDLNPEMGERFFVNKRFEFANAPPDEVTPQAHKALFSRLVNGAWHMNRIDVGPRDRSIAAPYRLVPGDERIVAWTLKPGDAVVFSWKHFVGMNEAVRIRTQYSWQLSSLVFGRMFFVVASVDPDSPADGCLLLNARGSHGIEAADCPSSSPEQLLAWQTTTRFQLHARLTLRNIYRSGIQIRAVDSDLAVMHLTPHRRKSGAAAFLKYFLVPV